MSFALLRLHNSFSDSHECVNLDPAADDFLPKCRESLKQDHCSDFVNCYFLEE